MVLKNLVILSTVEVFKALTPCRITLIQIIVFIRVTVGSRHTNLLPWLVVGITPRILLVWVARAVFVPSHLFLRRRTTWCLSCVLFITRTVGVFIIWYCVILNGC